jgi:hypothetical protein
MSVVWHGEEMLARAHEGAMRGLQTWIGMVDARAVELITSPPKTGRIYVRRGVSHQASAPGEAPASDLGTLVSERETELVPDELAARLRFMAAHARPLEDGTRNMAPRPFAKRALHETAGEGRKALAAEIAAALR